MARLKKGASHYEKAVTRLAALKSVDEKMDLGNGISFTSYEAAVQDLRNKLDDYNTSLSTIDEKRRLVQESEAFLKDMSQRVLTGVATCFGKNSNEYEMAGGTKKSVIKRTFNKKKEAA